jgi:hypothetical protein
MRGDGGGAAASSDSGLIEVMVVRPPIELEFWGLRWPTKKLQLL